MSLRLLELGLVGRVVLSNMLENFIHTLLQRNLALQ